MTKKLNLILLFVLAVAVVLVAYIIIPTSNSHPGPAVVSSAKDETNADVTILRFAISDMNSARFDSLIEAFEQDNPGVQIKTVSIEQTLGVNRGNQSWADDAYLTLASAADVINAPPTREAVAQGALLDLGPFMTAEPNFTADTFYPMALESVQWDGGTWGLPTELTYAMLYFNKTLFDAAGLDYPQPGWTWDDFLTTARALTIGQGETTTQWGFVEPSFDPVTFTQARAGLLFDPQTNPPTAHFADPAVGSALNWYTDLFLTHAVSPYYAPASDDNTPGAFFDNQGRQLIEAEQAAMWFGMGGFGFGGRGPGAGRAQQQIGLVPFPVNSPTDQSTPVSVNGFVISKGTAKADLAWQWVVFLSEQSIRRPGGFGGNTTTTTIPARPAVAEAGGFWDNLTEETATALRYAIDHAYANTYNGAGYDTFIDAAVAVMDGAPLEIVLDDAQALVTDELAAAAEAAPTPVAISVAEAEEQALSAGAVMVEFGMMGNPFEQESYTALAKQFQQLHPDIIIDIKTVQGFRGGLSLAEMAAEYDAFQASPNFSGDALTAILSIEPFLAEDPAVGKEDFYPAVLDQFAVQGQVWGLPGSVTVNTISYNKDLFDAAGAPYPDVNWTTTDFVGTAVALTKGEGDTRQYGFAPNPFVVNDLINMLDRLGADVLDDTVDPPRLVFTDPGVMNTVRWFAGLTTEYDVAPEYDTEADFRALMEERQALIDEGRVAMWSEGGGGGRGFFGLGQSTMNTGVLPLPVGDNSENGSGFQSVTGFFISADTEVRQAAWQWITFLTEQPTETNGLPARQAVAESEAYRQAVGADRAAAYLAAVSTGNRASFFQRISDEGQWFRYASEWLTEAYNAITSGELTVEEALTQAQTVSDAYRDCLIAADDFSDRETQQLCAEEATTVTQ